MKKTYCRNLTLIKCLCFATLGIVAQESVLRAQTETHPLQELFRTLPLVDPSLLPPDSTNTAFYFAGKYIDGLGFGSPYEYGPLRDFALPVYLLDTNTFVVDDRSLPWSDLFEQMQTNGTLRAQLLRLYMSESLRQSL